MTGDVYCGNWQEGAITGGGFNLPTPTIQVAWSNAPAGWGYLNGWLAYTKNTVAGSDSAKLYGLCAKINTEDIVNNTTPSTSGFINTYLRGGYIGSVIEPNSTSATVTHCQDGEEITGGGFGALAFTEDSSEVKPIRDYSEPNIRFYKSYPSGNGWAVEAKSNHQALTTELWAFAVCAKVITSLSLNGSVTVSGTERIESNPRYVPLTVSPNS